MLYHDALTLLLVGLALCLLVTDRFCVKALWACVRARSVTSDNMPALERACALGLTIATLLVHQHDVTTVMLAFVLVVLGGRTGNVFLPFWGVPALVLYGVFPSTWGTILVLPVLFWPGQKHDSVDDQRCIGVLLAIGLASHAEPFQPGLWMLGAVSVILALSAWGYVRHWKALSGIALILRPLLLLGVMTVAHNEGLGASAYAAMTALVLDISLHIIGVVKPSWRVLSFSMPPLPGFVVMWLGVHATLGVVTGAAGWTISGIVMAIVLALLSIVEAIRFLPTLQATRITLPFVGTAALLPTGVALLTYGVLLHGREDEVGRSLYDIAWSLQGGDGAVLAFPALWGILLVCWALLVRPWSLLSPISLPHRLSVSVTDQQRWFAWVLGNTPRLPWALRRHLVVWRWYGQELKGRIRHVHVPFSEMSLTLWLVFLGVVLAVLGITS